MLSSDYEDEQYPRLNMSNADLYAARLNSDDDVEDGLDTLQYHKLIGIFLEHLYTNVSVLI